MAHLTKSSLLIAACGSALALLPASHARARAVEVFAVQPLGQNSTLCDNMGKPILDRDFADWAKTGLNPAAGMTVSSAGFYFNQCFGGGFLDDLHNKLDPAGIRWNAGAASQFNEFAYGQRVPMGGEPGPFTNATVAHPTPMSYYTRALVPGLAAGATHYNAALTGRMTDTWGTVLRGGVAPFETGQVAYANGGDTALFSDPMLAGKRRAVIFAGLTDAERHFNNANQIFNALTANGYAAADISILFGDGMSKIIGSGAMDLPAAWVNRGPATPGALKAVMTGLGLGANDQFAFYATDHGGNTAIRGGAAIPGAGGTNWQSQMSMSSQIRSAMGMTPDNQPEFSMDYSGLSGGAEVFFNGVSLGLLPDSLSQATFTFPLDESNVYPGTNEISILSGGSSFTVSEFRLYSGAIPELSVVPGPGTGVLAGLGLLVAARRRRC